MSEPVTLSLLTDAEKATVLDALIGCDVEFGRRAEQAARRLLAAVTTGEARTSRGEHASVSTERPAGSASASFGGCSA